MSHKNSSPQSTTGKILGKKGATTGLAWCGCKIAHWKWLFFTPICGSGGLDGGKRLNHRVRRIKPIQTNSTEKKHKIIQLWPSQRIPSSPWRLEYSSLQIRLLLSSPSSTEYRIPYFLQHIRMFTSYSSPANTEVSNSKRTHSYTHPPLSPSQTHCFTFPPSAGTINLEQSNRCGTLMFRRDFLVTVACVFVDGPALLAVVGVVGWSISYRLSTIGSIILIAIRTYTSKRTDQLR